MRKSMGFQFEKGRFSCRKAAKKLVFQICLILVTTVLASEGGTDEKAAVLQAEEGKVVFSSGQLGLEDFAAAVAENRPVTVDINACTLETETLVEILDTYPEYTLLFTLEPYGVPFDTEQELLVLDGITITDLVPLKEVVPHLKNLGQIDMCGCGIDDETMDALNTELEGVKVVWTVDLKHWQLRTDITHFATWDYAVDEDGYIYTAKNVTNNTSESLAPLKYCKELVALDLGHNRIKDISFLSGLTNLKYLIIALNEIKDITPLSGLTELKYLEIFNNDIKDITPIADLPKLEALYMTSISVKDVSCLYGKETLKLLYLEGIRFDKAARKEIESALPGCTVLYRNQNTTSSRAWRVHPYYAEMRRALGWRVD